MKEKGKQQDIVNCEDFTEFLAIDAYLTQFDLGNVAAHKRRVIWEPSQID
jgi:hypothetical protein